MSVALMMTILGFICCSACAYWGFTEKAIPFVAGLGWLTLALMNVMNFMKLMGWRK
jgi:hypothetical protein